MSRIAKNPVIVPAGVTVDFQDNALTIKGPLGSICTKILSIVSVSIENNQILFSPNVDTKLAKSLSGTYRALVNNVVLGVTKGFEKKLTLVGVGYRAQAQGDQVQLSLGFSHPLAHQMPEGVKVETPTPTEIILKGFDKQRIGQVAAEIRAYRPPEPYKGKGVRYSDEVVILKETKKK
jgi:large subunit ribosomal protein L6